MDLISLKKMLITTLLLTTMFLLAENILFVHKPATSSRPAITVKTTPINQRKMALTEKEPVLTKSKILDVPIINQMAAPQLIKGCEVTSLAMLLNYNGYQVSKNELAEKIKKVPFTYPNGLKGNPNEGFVGEMNGEEGFAVYNGPIRDLARTYAGDNVVNLTNSPFTDLLKRVERGEPVWVITTKSNAPVSEFEKWPTPQGIIDITHNEHSVVITGYDQTSIYVNDPYGYKNRQVDRNIFENAWVQMGRQAIVIEK
jgi:uncharacterized protein YvpB